MLVLALSDWMSQVTRGGDGPHLLQWGGLRMTESAPGTGFHFVEVGTVDLNCKRRNQCLVRDVLPNGLSC